ncbi:MAG TPA: Hsp70 family protein, partial [Pseudonocardia sp.]|nr:Hsp70 family protein [Pseudonocardia sp.]
MGYQLGIDLGTTYTAAAVCRSTGGRWSEPEVVTLGDRASAVPSVIFAGADGQVLVGEAADRRAVTDPDGVVREFKRRVGDPTPFVVGGRAWGAEELCARMVRWVVDRVAAREGGPAERVAVTHPASWGGHKKDLLARALDGHGLAEVTFLAEPQAAALHYAAAERVAAGSTIAVYDLGGGTFDAAVVRKNGTFALLGRPEGLDRLGGVDFDQVVFDHVVAGAPEAFAGLDEADPAVLAAVARLRRECTEAKEALSADTEVTIPVLVPQAQTSVRLHRSEFEAAIAGRVDETVAALRRAVSSAGLAPEQLTAVLLVGGSSRIPLVAQRVSEVLGRPVAVDADPKNAIAKGAALAVAPRPTSSWPAAVVAPVPPQAPPAAAAQAGAPTPRAPFGASGGSAPGGSVVPVPVPAPPAAVALPPRPPIGGPPATAQFAGDADEPVWEDDEPPARRRPAGLLVGAGGLLAVLALVVTVLLWPERDVTPTGGFSTGTGGAPVTTEVPPATTPPAGPSPAAGEPAADRPPANRGGGGGGGRAPATTQPPPVPTTVKPTTPPPPSSSAPPSSP